MRWGISNEVTNTHMATTICLNEIATCQNLSIGPNFIVDLKKALINLKKTYSNKFLFSGTFKSSLRQQISSHTNIRKGI